MKSIAAVAFTLALFGQGPLAEEAARSYSSGVSLGPQAGRTAKIARKNNHLKCERITNLHAGPPGWRFGDSQP